MVIAIIAITMPIIYTTYNKVEQHTNKRVSNWAAPITWLITSIIVMIVGIIIVSYFKNRDNVN
jgi:hypothetical protein